VLRFACGVAWRGSGRYNARNVAKHHRRCVWRCSERDRRTLSTAWASDLPWFLAQRRKINLKTERTSCVIWCGCTVGYIQASFLRPYYYLERGACGRAK